MQITNATIQALQTVVHSDYQEGWDNTQTFHDMIATTINSITELETFGWMQRLPKAREWQGPRVVNNLQNFSFVILNRLWEATVGVNLNSIKDDKLGIYAGLFQEFGRLARKWPDQMLKTSMQLGTTTGLGFDGLPFFSQSHPLSGSNQSNDIVQSSGPDATGFDAVRAAMISYVGEDGEPLGVNPNLIVCPPQLETKARTTVTAVYGASGATNVQVGQANVLVVPELANEPTIWYVMDTTKGIRPFVFTLRESPELVSRDQLTDDNVFNYNEARWGFMARGAMSYGPWQLCARVRAS